jgi:hypothetical protein
VDDLFLKFLDFRNFNIHNIKSGSDLEKLEKLEKLENLENNNKKNIIIVSKQLMQNYTDNLNNAENANSKLKNINTILKSYNFDYILKIQYVFF